MELVINSLDIEGLADWLLNQLTPDSRDPRKKPYNLVLLYAYNCTGKTRLSTVFNNKTKKTPVEGNTSLSSQPTDLVAKKHQTLYFNSFTEDLFIWENDLDNDEERVLRYNPNSSFCIAFENISLESRINARIEKYANFKCRIDYDENSIHFDNSEYFDIKISRAEESLFIWSVYIIIAELAIEEAEGYEDIKFLYIDDPVSSLDDNNIIQTAVELAMLTKRAIEAEKKVIVSTHHPLFYNILYNHLSRKYCKDLKTHTIFMHKMEDDTFALYKTNDSPFMYHLEQLQKLNKILDSPDSDIDSSHYNQLRTILEKIVVFFGLSDIGDCFNHVSESEKELFVRQLHYRSHNRSEVFDTKLDKATIKDEFKIIFNSIVLQYKFNYSTNYEN